MRLCRLWVCSHRRPSSDGLVSFFNNLASHYLCISSCYDLSRCSFLYSISVTFSLWEVMHHGANFSFDEYRTCFSLPDFRGVHILSMRLSILFLVPASCVASRVSSFAGSTSTAVFPPPAAGTASPNDPDFPDASHVGNAGATPSKSRLTLQNDQALNMI